MARVKVNQADGEIVISVNGGPAKTYAVTDSHVTVATEDVPTFLWSLPDAVVDDQRFTSNPPSAAEAPQAATPEAIKPAE